MNKLIKVAVAAVSLMCIAGPASAQSLKEKLLGVWTLEEGSETSADGKKAVPWSAGSLIVDPSGHFSFFLIGTSRPKGTGDPRIPVGPMVGYYGTYTVNEADNTLVYEIEHMTNPSFDGTGRTLKVTFQGDTMTTTTSVKSPQGTVTAANEWKRSK